MICKTRVRSIVQYPDLMAGIFFWSLLTAFAFVARALSGGLDSFDFARTQMLRILIGSGQTGI